MKSVAQVCLTLMFSMTLIACGGSGGSGGGGPTGGDPVIKTSPAFDSPAGAAAMAMGAAGFAEMGVGMLEGTDDDQMEGRSIASRDSNPCDSGSMADETGTKTVYGEEIATTILRANDCRNEYARVDGILETGENLSETIFYLKATDTSGSLDSGYLVNEMPIINMSMRQRALVEICDGCESPTEMKMNAYMVMTMDSPEGKFSMQFGKSASDRVNILAENLGTQTATTINGYIAANDHQGCSFAGTYSTNVRVISNHSTDAPVSGDVDITLDTGSTYNVRFENDIVYVNDEIIDQRDLHDLEDSCDFDDD